MRKSAILIAAAMLCGCDGEENSLGVDQPIRVVGGQYVEGTLSGSDGPAVTSLEFNSSLVLPGQAGKGFQGRVEASAMAIAVDLAHVGDGHWIVPTGALDPQYAGERLWSFRADFAHDLEPGPHTLRVAGIDASGQSGPWSQQSLCVASPIPDNLHACDPTRPLPAAVFSLSWSAHADVDLAVQGPDGRWITAGSPLVDPVAGGTNPGASAAKIDRDAVSGCRPDSTRRENLVFQERPAPGTTFRIHARLFDGCGQTNVPFELGIYEPMETEAGTRQVRAFHRSGVLNHLDVESDHGLFLFEYTF